MFIDCRLGYFDVAHRAVDGDLEWRIVWNAVSDLLSLLQCGRGGLTDCPLEVIKDMFGVMLFP